MIQGNYFPFSKYFLFLLNLKSFLQDTNRKVTQIIRDIDFNP